MAELPIEYLDLPGADLVAEGMEDLAAGTISVDACLAALVRPHLLRAGIEIGCPDGLIPEPERKLYHLLGADGSGRDPYPRYNSLKRRIVSFARALQVRVRMGSPAE